MIEKKKKKKKKKKKSNQIKLNDITWFSNNEYDGIFFFQVYLDSRNLIVPIPKINPQKIFIHSMYL